MKLTDVMKLKPGEEIVHTRYGECVVKEVMLSRGQLFGVLIVPNTDDGRVLLQRDSGVDAPLLEDSIRRLKKKN